MTQLHAAHQRLSQVWPALFLILISCAACTRGAPQVSRAAVNTDLTPPATATVRPTATTAPAATPMATSAPVATPIAEPTTATMDSPLASATDVGVREPDIQTGIDIYLANYCGLCHTLSVAETKGIFGPVHDGIGRVAEERIADPAYTGQATTAAEYIYESLVDPRAFVSNDYKLTRHPMPAFTHLSEDDLNALVALLVAQK